MQAGLLSRTVRRAQWRALGVAEADLEKPTVAVVNTSSSLAICYAHVDRVSAAVQTAIRAAGGLPFEVRTAAPSDGLSFAVGRRGYLANARDTMVRDVELMVGGAALDGMVLLSSCDSTTPAHLIAALRLDLPAIVVPCGYQRGGAGGEVFGLYEGVGAVAAGRMAERDLRRLADQAFSCAGVCGGLGTANTMHMLAEALGLALPGSAPVAGDNPRLLATAAGAGTRIVELVASGMRPRQIVGRAAIENAAMLLLALGGANSCVGHLSAIAEAAGVRFDMLAYLEQAGRDIPRLCDIAPNGPAPMQMLEAAGGTLAVMRQLRSRLHLDAASVSGEAWRDILGCVAETDGPVHSLAVRAGGDPGLLVLRGNLAPAGALVRPGIAAPGLRRFAGPARLLPDADAGFAALADGTLRAGQVAVLRGGVDDFACALFGAGLAAEVALVTDGGYSGLSKGLVVGHVAPADGPIAALREGQTVTIDLDARRLDSAA